MDTGTKIIIVFILLAIAVPFSIEGFDYMANCIFYEHGLQFSWQWAFQWWTILTVTMAIISLLVATSYLLMREPTKRHYYTAFMIGFSIWWQQVSGNMDLIFFLFDKIRGTYWIDWDTVWWWSPFNWLFGFEWTSKNQVAMTAIFDVFWLGLWVLWFLVMNKDRIWNHLNRAE